MNIELNGNPETFTEASLTVREVLKKKGWSFPLIIVRINGTLVDRNAWDATRIDNGDLVEMLHLVSGG